MYSYHNWRAWYNTYIHTLLARPHGAFQSQYNGSYTMMAKPIRALELHYPMIQFLIILIIWTLNYPDFLLKPQRVWIIEAQL